jgi:hypothetical protein
MRFGAFVALLWKHRFRVHPIRWPMAFLLLLITPFNSVMGLVQSLIYGRRIRETPIKRPPVFIVGHWRSGTTYLHELLSLDDRFGSPTTYQCFAPHHFLLTEWFFIRFMGWLIPKQRPMDNMAASLTAPQEDEFALMVLGAPSPYLRMAFPNDPPPHLEMLSMQGVPPDDLARFEQTLLHFARLMTHRTGQQLLLKSPPHTGRLETLVRLFPGAKFVHITRDPYAIFSSTRKLWESLDDVQGLQRPRHEHLDEYIYDCLERMYRGFEDQRSRLPAESIVDLKYEDLVQDPVGHLREIYQRLDLGDFEPVRQKLETFVAGKKDYKTNRHELPAGVKEEVQRRWRSYFERYGYT